MKRINNPTPSSPTAMPPLRPEGELFRTNAVAFDSEGEGYLFGELPYNNLLKARARELRKAGNLAEVLLWKELKNKKLLGLDFTRQKVIGNFIVDFFCAEKRIVIEVDGSSHDDKIEHDSERDALMKGYGLEVIRVTDKDVKSNLSGVIEFLIEKLK